MPAERYYIDQDLHQGNHVSLEDQEFRHLAQVMRTKSGETIELVNGKGVLADATVDQIGKKHAIVHVESIQKQSGPTTPVVLAQAIPRINRLDFILEKGTELGMTELWLFPGKLSERKDLTEHQLERMRGLAIAAMKQCGRLWLPQIVVKPPLKEWKSLDLLSYFGDLSSEAPLFSKVLAGSPLEKGILFFTGPESGFEEDEEQKLRELGAKGVKLHSNILRTDTASIAALSLITCRN